MRIFLFFLFFFSFLLRSDFALWADEQLDFYHADKKLDWELYQSGNALYLSGQEDAAKKKWQEAASKFNWHAAARLYQEDLQNEKKDYAIYYEPLLKLNFAISRYLTLRYIGMSDTAKLERLKKDVIKSMLELEKTEDYWAISIVGNYYLENFTSKDEFFLGVKYLLKAAEGGYSPAQDRLGMLYKEGHANFNKDQNKALQWLSKAAATKDKYACLHLAQIYHKASEDTNPDIPKSIPYYEEAAQQGLFDALLNLGLIYEEGQAVPKDSVKSHHYLNLLLDCKDPEIYKFLGTRYFYAKEEWKDKNQGLFWYQKAAEIGTIVEKYKYADFYFSDKDVRNYKLALSLFLLLVPKDGVVTHQFHILVHLRLGEIYFKGLGIKQDYLEAKKYYEKN